MQNLLSLRDVLRCIESLKWSDALYLPENDVWRLESHCAVLNPDDVEHDEAEAPVYAIEHGLQYALGIQDIRDIIDNLKQQRCSHTDEDILAAMLHYYNHDAFIVLV